MELKRSYYKADVTRSYRSDPVRCDESEANLISSQLQIPGDFHAPCLDIDFGAQLVPSKTFGHHHLYLDMVMDWQVYERLLHALSAAKVIERGYCEASIKHHGTYLATNTPASLEAALLQRAVIAEHRVKELEVELEAAKELLSTVMQNR